MRVRNYLGSMFSCVRTCVEEANKIHLLNVATRSINCFVITQIHIFFTIYMYYKRALMG